jgi:hypothetical protein
MHPGVFRSNREAAWLGCYTARLQGNEQCDRRKRGARRRCGLTRLMAAHRRPPMATVSHWRCSPRIEHRLRRGGRPRNQCGGAPPRDRPHGPVPLAAETASVHIRGWSHRSMRQEQRDLGGPLSDDPRYSGNAWPGRSGPPPEGTTRRGPLGSRRPLGSGQARNGRSPAALARALPPPPTTSARCSSLGGVARRAPDRRQRHQRERPHHAAPARRARLPRGPQVRAVVGGTTAGRRSEQQAGGAGGHHITAGVRSLSGGTRSSQTPRGPSSRRYRGAGGLSGKIASPAEWCQLGAVNEQSAVAAYAAGPPGPIAGDHVDAGHATARVRGPAPGYGRYRTGRAHWSA